MDHDVDIMKSIMDLKLIPGQIYGLIACKWIYQWIASGRNSQFPVDNSSLFINGILKPRLVQGYDYFIISEQMWKMYFEKCTGGPYVSRYAYKSDNGRVDLDLYPVYTRIRVVSQIPPAWEEFNVFTIPISRHENLENIPAIVNSSIANPQEEIFRTTPNQFRMYIGLYGDDFLEIRMTNQDSYRKLESYILESNGIEYVRVIFYKTPDTTPQKTTTMNTPQSSLQFQNPGSIWHTSTDQDKPHSKSLSADDTEFFSGTLPTSSAVINRGNQIASPALGVCGFQNLGNSCYMNSILQCLIQTQSLVKWFFDDQQLRSSMHNTIPFGDSLSACFQEIVKLVWCGNHSVVFPVKLKHILSMRQPRFAGNNQHDAHEFLLVLLGMLHEESKQVTTGASSEPSPRVIEAFAASPTDAMSDVTMESLDDESTRIWQRFMDMESSYILDLFRGMLLSRMYCEVCGLEAHSFEAFMGLSIAVTAPSLEQCLRDFSCTESLDDNMWYCIQCQDVRRASRQLSFLSAYMPKILVVQFKRFTKDGSKIVTGVSYPEKLDDFVGSCVNGVPFPEYELFAIVKHHGHDIGYGHYTSEVLCSDMIWRRINDSVIETYSDILGHCDPDAYILFYRKADHG